MQIAGMNFQTRSNTIIRLS
ncbi:DUF6783 domain-containing protein [uncultured Robinsoniella sp.]